MDRLEMVAKRNIFGRSVFIPTQHHYPIWIPLVNSLHVTALTYNFTHETRALKRHPSTGQMKNGY
jgi:hypothetical protein